MTHAPDRVPRHGLRPRPRLTRRRTTPDRRPPPGPVGPSCSLCWSPRWRRSSPSWSRAWPRPRASSCSAPCRPAAAARSRTSQITVDDRRRDRGRRGQDRRPTASGRSTFPGPGAVHGRARRQATARGRQARRAGQPHRHGRPGPRAAGQLRALHDGSQRQPAAAASGPIQLFVDGLRFGLLIAMCAVGLSLIFGTTGLTNFAHGELVTIGAVVAWYINVQAGVPLIPATVLAMVVGAAVGSAERTGALAAAAPPGHRAGRRARRLDRPVARPALPDPDRLRRPVRALRGLPEPAGGRLRARSP